MRGVMILHYTNSVEEFETIAALEKKTGEQGVEYDFVVRCCLTGDMWASLDQLYALVKAISERATTQDRDAFCSVETRFYTWKHLDQHTLLMHVRPHAREAQASSCSSVQKNMHTLGKATKFAAMEAGVWDARPMFGVFVCSVLRGQTSDALAQLVEHVGEAAFGEFSCEGGKTTRKRDDIRWLRTSCDPSQPPCIRKKRKAAVHGEAWPDPAPEVLASRFVVPLDLPGVEEMVRQRSDLTTEDEGDDDEEEEERGRGYGRRRCPSVRGVSVDEGGAKGKAGIVLELVSAAGGQRRRDEEDDDDDDEEEEDRRGKGAGRGNQERQDYERIMRHLTDGAAQASVSRVFAECQRGGLFGGNAPAKKREWLDSVLRLPLGKFAHCPANKTTESETVRNMRAAMDAVVHGLDGAKDAVLEMAGKKLRSPAAPVRCLLLEGPPGCGKTTFATRAIGEALKRPVRVINLGGAKDSTTLVGHGYTYEGSRPGRIVEEVTASGVMDPVLVFDEVDKISDSPAGQEIANVLMRLVDPAQNSAFTDMYMPGIPLDMSRVFVVFLCNDAHLMNRILLDRVRSVTFPDMNRATKLQVLRNYIIPRAMKDYGDCLSLEAVDADLIATRLVDELVASSPSFCDDACNTAGGMRTLEKVVERLMMVANLRALEQGDRNVCIADLERTMDAVRKENQQKNAVRGEIPMGLYT